MTNAWKKTTITYLLGDDVKTAVRVTVTNVVETATADQIASFGGILETLSGRKFLQAMIATQTQLA